MNESTKLTAERAASISVSPTSLTFAASASSKTVQVTCSDTTWTISGSANWVTATKTSSTQMRIAVTKNSGGIRKTGITALSGSNPAAVTVTQAANIDVRDKITLYKQIGQTCAGTCICMCINVDPSTVSELLDYVNWNDFCINDYTLVVSPDTAGKSLTFTSVYNNSLAKGLPAIVKINTGEYQHWVVLVAFTGTNLNDASSYICADPATGSYVTLDKATYYGCVNNRFYNYGVYAKANQ